MLRDTPHPFVHKCWPKPPSERDLEIHRLVRVELRPQKEVAKEYDLSQGRVSQIVADVDMRTAIGHLLILAPPEEKYLVKKLLCQQLELAQSLALETHRAQMQPQTQLARSETLDGQGKVKSHKTNRRTHHGRPDPRWLNIYTTLAKEVCELKCELPEMQRESHRSLTRLADWKEDHDAELMVHMVEEIDIYAERCREGGREVPNMPVVDRTEIEEFVRRARRANAKVRAIECLPPKWSRVAKQVFYPHLDPDEPLPANYTGPERTETFLKPRPPRAAAAQQSQQPPETKSKNPYAKKSVPTYDPNEPWPPPPLPEGLSPMEKAIEYNKQVRWIPGEGYLHPPGSFWYEWAKSQRDGTPPPFPLVEGPPGGEGRTYADGSWLTPDLQYGGGSPGVKSVAQSEAERILKMREEGWQEVIVGLDGEPRPKEEVKK